MSGDTKHWDNNICGSIRQYKITGGPDVKMPRKWKLASLVQSVTDLGLI